MAQELGAQRGVIFRCTASLEINMFWIRLHGNRQGGKITKGRGRCDVALDIARGLHSKSVCSIPRLRGRFLKQGRIYQPAT